MSAMVVGWFSYLTSDVVRPRTTDKQGFEGVQPLPLSSSLHSLSNLFTHPFSPTHTSHSPLILIKYILLSLSSHSQYIFSSTHLSISITLIIRNSYSNSNLHISYQFFYTYPTLSSTLYILSLHPYLNPHIHNHSLTYYLYTLHNLSSLYSILIPTYPHIFISYPNPYHTISPAPISSLILLSSILYT